MTVELAIAVRKALGLPEKPELPYPPAPCWSCKNEIEENELFGRARGKLHCEACHRYFCQPVIYTKGIPCS